MTPIETLRHEHQAILLALRGAEEEVQRIVDNGVVRAEQTSRLADFLLNFVGCCHHTKEGRHLFPKMKERGGPAEAALIERLVYEHDEAAGLLEAIVEALPKAADGDTASIHIVRDSLHAYVRLLRAHMEQEDGLLFPSAAQILMQHEEQLLTMEFERVDEEEIGAGAHERYLRVAHRLAQEAG